ncbi:MAG: hypothetical protein Q9190_000821 [Brigantiaea leucoxantha]
MAKPKQSGTSVWQGFENDTGWTSNGLVFLMGLINVNYGFAGLDGAVHLAEDCSNAASAIPLALASAVGIGFTTTLVFIVAALYCVKDVKAVVNSPTKIPLYEIWFQATQSKTAATVFVILIAVLWLFTLIGVQQTASRLTWAFARDGGLIGSGRLQKIDKTLKLPVWAMGRNSKLLSKPDVFHLGRAGWIPNLVTVAWACFELGIYNLPVELPVEAGNMNYTAAVLGAIALFITLNWFFHGKFHYSGPRLDFLHHIVQEGFSSERD